MTSEGKSINHFLTLLDAEEGNGVVTGYSITPFFKERKEEGHQFYEYLSEKIYFAHWKSQMGLPIPMLTFPHPEYVQLNFCLKGSLVYMDGENGEKIFSNKSGFQNILYKGCKKLLIQTESSQSVEILIIYLRKDFFHDYSHLGQKMGKEFLENLKCLKCSALFSQNLPISNRMSSIIHMLINSQECAGFKKNLVDARVIELLTLQLEAFEQNLLKDKQQNLKKEDIARMEEARSYLLARLDNSVTLKELAHQIGTNEFILKKHFKMMYGKSVFAYLLEYKMEKARTMLMQTSVPIAEIALELGYKHATHFSAAFKRHYGYLPKELR